MLGQKLIGLTVNNESISSLRTSKSMRFGMDTMKTKEMGQFTGSNWYSRGSGNISVKINFYHDSVYAVSYDIKNLKKKTNCFSII